MIALFIGLAVLVLGGGAYAISQLGGDDDPAQPNTPQRPVVETTADDEGATGAGGGAEPARKPDAETNVAVLNGTTIPGLAGQVADQVEAAGYLRGSTDNAPDQARPDTTVHYGDGARTQARAIARLLKVSATANVERLDAETAALAPEADVVVVTGADQTP